MSSYIALYRKWRPQVFSDVIGQEHITDVLKGEIQRGSVSHAYLFCGSRGTGKTTCAKILAKAVSCINPQNGDPCGECENCKIAAESFDISEIDAASNNGVDNIRELREEVMYPPSELKRRVYIIDEVHMLSTGAFNALLKTLEEPPEHAMFILATTELNKIPATILSRCKRFDFHRITPENIAKRLSMICKEEKIPLTNGAVMTISRLAGGAMRDALSMLELFVGKTEEITEEMCAAALGVIGRGPVMKLLNAVAQNNCEKALQVISEAYDGSKDMAVLLSECADAVRDMLMIKYTNNPEKFVDGSADVISELAECAKSFTKQRLIYSIEILDDAQSKMARTVFSRRAVIETCIIKLCDINFWQLDASLNTRLAELEDKILTGCIPIQNNGATILQNAVFEPSAEASAYPIDEEHTDVPPEQNFEAPPPFDYDTPQQVAANTAASKQYNSQTQSSINPATNQSKSVSTNVSSSSFQNAVETTYEPLTAFPDILEEIKRKDVVLSSMLAGAKGYSVSNQTIAIAVPPFAQAMLKNDAKKMGVIMSCVKKYVGDVTVKIQVMGSKTESEWEL